jgi:NDP-sugar pyrophosphorylase family protein
MKYEITDKAPFPGSRLRVIRALQPIERYDVEVGDLGGAVEGRGNLSQDGDCWLTKGTSVGDNAYVAGNAFIDKSEIMDAARISDDAQICNSHISGISRISGSAIVTDSQVFDSIIRDTARINNSTLETAWIDGSMELLDAEVLNTRSCGAVTIGPNVIHWYRHKDGCLRLCQGSHVYRLESDAVTSDPFLKAVALLIQGVRADL